MSKILSRIEEIAVAIALAVMSIIAFINVISRNFAGISLSFTEEITVNLFVFLTFMGASIGVRKNAHLGFTLLYDIALHSLKRIIVILVGLITTSIFITFTYFGLNSALFQMEITTKTPALGFPQWIFTLGIPIGTLFCTYRTIEATIIELRDLSSGMGASK